MLYDRRPPGNSSRHVARDGTRLGTVAATRYPELNALLDELVAGVRGVLGDNLCGAYLHGSFALGEGDVHSDVDFLIVTRDEPDDREVAGLQQLHARLYALETPWAQHLEGSYVPRARLRRFQPVRSRFLFLDNGADRLVPDEHCDTAVVRWLLREHGIVLAGPEPRELVDPVTPDGLRREARTRIREYAEWAAEPTPQTGGMSRWKQPYLVLTFCRLLHTLAEGLVTSKREAAEWALARLDPEWSGLIRAALADRPDPWRRVREPAAADAVERTLAFARFVSRSATDEFSSGRRS
jgi:predicted nucleotidyltransferase